MAKRAYNGMLVSVVSDITKNKECYALVNYGNTWSFFSQTDVRLGVLDTIDTVEENDVYMQWYNASLTEESSL